MQDFFSRKNIKKILLIALAIIIMFLGLQNITSVWHVFLKIWELILPFVLGGCIAFIINVPMKDIETKIFRKPFKGRRVISCLLTILIILGLIALALSVVIPKLVETGKEIMKDYQAMGGSLEGVQQWVVRRFPTSEEYLHRLNLSYEKLLSYISNLFQGKYRASLVHNARSIVTSAAQKVANFFIGCVFSIYVLMQKEKLGRQNRQIVYALSKEKHADRVMEIGSLTYTTFSNFIRGQVLEACILGLMFFVTLSLFRMPYALLISIVITFTALIPIFGAFLGAAVGFLLILIQSPKDAFLFLVLFIVLQQIEGKLVYPHVVGSSVGLPSIWVLFAITVGAQINGIVGMVLAVPLCSVLYVLLREFVYGRLKEKNVSPEKYQNPPAPPEPLPQEESPEEVREEEAPLEEERAKEEIREHREFLQEEKEKRRKKRSAFWNRLKKKK